MNIQLPRCHDFNKYQFLNKDCGCRSWEISAPKEDSFEWSVVMSYLTSANLGQEGDFKDRLATLGYSKNNFRDIKKRVSSFNPFLNRYSSFFNHNLKEVVGSFKIKMQQMESENSNNGSEFKIKMSSNILKCSIAVLYTTDEGDIQDLKEFPYSIPTHHEILEQNSLEANVSYSTSENTEKNTSLATKLTLYCHLSEGFERFHFGMKKDKGLELKRGAFFKILKQANVLKKSRKDLEKLQNEEESFVTSVIKSNCRALISNLYKTSYHAWKLAEAGFEMDPRVPDKRGFSAFYYAIISGDLQILNVLFNYAANACNYSEKTFRNPDEFILNNLENLRTTLNKDIERSQDDTNFHLSFKIGAKQLLRLTNFLYSICQRITDEKTSNRQDKTEAKTGQEVTEVTPNVLKEHWEVDQRKNVILAILETYNRFFFSDNEEQTDIVSIDRYIEFENYYKNLDDSTTLFFFDNIFLLKERLKLDNDEYFELESCFFLCALSHKYFLNEILETSLFLTKMLPNEKEIKMFIKEKFCSPKCKFIPFLERLYLRQKIHSFIEVVKQESCHITLSCIPEDEVKNTLANLPEVKDELMICRLLHYLKTALRQHVGSVKQSLIIERALQVLGETLVFGTQNRNSLCFLLYLSVPENTFRLLKQIRNDLSHIKEYTFSPKIKAEKTFSLFNGVLFELKVIFETMRSIFDMQKFRLIDFVLQRGLKAIQDNLSPTGRRGVRLSSEELSDASKHLKDTVDKLHSISENQPIAIGNTYFLQNLSRVTDEMIRKDELWADESSVSDNKDKFMWPLKFIFKYFPQDSEEIKSKIEEICDVSENCDVRNKLKMFWSEYQSLIRRVMSTNSSEGHLTQTVTDIEKFKKTIRGFNYLTEEDIEWISSKIPQDVVDSVRKIKEMRKSLESGMPLTNDQELKFLEIFLSKRQYKKLKELDPNDKQGLLEIIKKADDPIADLNSLFDGSCVTMNKENLNKLCKRMKFSDDIKERLSKLNIGQKRRNASENGLDVLLNRVTLLREILIEENSEIQELWNKAQHTKTKQYTKHKIMQRYVRDSDVQASVEMLLFDCMILLGNQNLIESLWIKPQNLFTGINLRNVIGHGSPTLENIGKLLDPEDLPSVLVDEMLRLVKDEKAIRSIHDFCKKTGSDFDKFHKLINDDDYTDHVETRENIQECPRWRRYSILLPQTSIKGKTITDISHSSSIDSEEC